MSTIESDSHMPQDGAASLMTTGGGSPAAGKLPLRHKIGYGFGQLIEITVASMLTIFALFYITGVCGLPGGLAGAALAVGLVIDAILDPLIGSLSDNWKSRFGRRIPFMVVGLIPLVLSFNLLFALPTNLDQAALFLWVMVLSVTLRVSISIFGLPYQALGIDMTDDYTERSSMAAWRWGIGIMGTFAVIGLGYGVFLSGPGGVSNRDGYFPLALSLSVLMVVCAGIAIRTGLATRHLRRENVPTEHALFRRLFDELREVFRNRTFRILFASILLLQISQGVNQALGMYMNLYFWRFENGQLGVMSITAVFGMLFAAPIAGPLLKRMEKRSVLILSQFSMVLCAAIPITLKALNLLPDNTNGLALIVTVFAVLGATTFAISIIAFMAIVPDAVDEHELLFGTRREGIFLAGWLFAGKAASGVGLLVGGLVLQALNFPAQAPGQDVLTVSVTGQTLTWLGLAAGPGSGLIALAATVIVMGYAIDSTAHARIMAGLVARRGNA